MLLLGDELDGPRGRIYLIKDMLAGAGPPAADTVKHIDRCLSCLACMTTCPSGVNYMHLVDHARRWIEEKYRRPWAERALRRLLGQVLTRPSQFRLALRLAILARPFARFLPGRLGAVAGAGPGLGPGRIAGRSRGRLPGARRAADARGAARRLRPAGARPRDQRGDDPASDPPRLRGRRGSGQRLLRLAHPSSGAGDGRACLGPRRYRRLGARAARPAGSTRSRSMPRAAARRSRITASCCARTRPMPTRRRGSPASPAT